VEREKSTILSEYQAYLGSQKTLFDTFAQALWGNERYGLSVIGREEVISGMTLEAIEEYRESKYLNDKIRLIALGSIEYKSAFRTIENCFKNFVISHKISILSNSITLAAQSSGVVLSQKKYNMLNISLGFKTFAFPTRERLVIDFISHMLVSGNKGILFEDIRETKKLCYAIGTNHLCFTHGGGFCIWAAIDKSKLETFIHEILLVVATIKMKEFIESKIDIVKNQMSLMYRTMLEDPSNILPYIGKYFLNGQIFSENVIMNDIKRISVDDIALILNDYFVIDNLALGIVGDLNYEELQSAVDRVL
jgi:predicted Zn-dependent peptidase